MKEVIIKPEAKHLKTFHLETKINSSSDRKIKGYASTKFPDRMNEVVSPSALKLGMESYLLNPVVLRDHDQSKPIGKMIDFQVTSDGLYVTDQIAKGTQDSEETWSLIEQGVYRGLSIGFIPKRVNYDGEFPIIEELELIEHSVVSIPANRQSLFSIAKAFQLGTDLIEKELPRIGLEKTLYELASAVSILEQNFKFLPASQRIEIEALNIKLSRLFDGVTKPNENELEAIEEVSSVLKKEIELLEEIHSLLEH